MSVKGSYFHLISWLEPRGRLGFPLVRMTPTVTLPYYCVMSCDVREGEKKLTSSNVPTNLRDSSHVKSRAVVVGKQNVCIVKKIRKEKSTARGIVAIRVAG